VKPDGADTLKTRPTLLSRIRRGDEDGWGQFYELYDDFIYAVARAAGLSHDESKDIVQETMITVRDYISHFVPDENRAKFRTWLRKIVQSRVADQYRKKNRSPLDKLPPDTPEPRDDTATSTINRIPNLNEVELDRLIDGKFEEAILSQARRWAKEHTQMEHYQAYDLFEIQGLSARDVAASLRISPVTVRVRAFRVRRAVEREIRRIAAILDRPPHDGKPRNQL
jgi:RNA polymerase sigma-70 factor (ECF subfamily)